MNNIMTDSAPLKTTNQTLPNTNPTPPPPQQELNEYQQDIGLSRKIEFDRGNPLSFNFRSNKVYTIPYSCEGFIRFILNKYKETPLNLCIVLIIVYYLDAFIFEIEEVTILNLHYTISFHISVLVLMFFFYTYSYIKIYMNDLKTNNQLCHIYSNEEKKFVDSKWKEIIVGNIIRVNKDEVVPADILILESMDHNHQCYVDCSSVNGNFDKFIVKRACNDTQAPTMRQIKFADYVKNIKGALKYEEPNSSMHSFNGRLKLEAFPRASAIKDENFVMRGSTVKNIRFIYGLVVYTGMETKIMMTLKFTQSSASSKSYEEFKGGPLNQMKDEQFTKVIIKKDREFIRQGLKKMQYALIFFYLIIIILSFFLVLHNTCNLYFSYIEIDSENQNKTEGNYSSNDTALYVGFKRGDSKSHVFNELFLSLTAFILNFHFIFPFDWFILIEIAYVLLSIFIKWDVNVKKEKKDIVEIINENCLANFGQVRHILTDKTGTLTKRKFQLKAVSIHGKLFSFDPTEQADENYIFKLKENDMNDLEIIKELNTDQKFGPVIKEFIENLCLCHSVKVSGDKENTGDKNQGDNKDLETNIKDPSGKLNNNLKTSMQFGETNNFGSIFAEEKATLSMFAKIGYKVTKAKNNLIELNVNGNLKKFDILALNKFSKDRNRMSVLIRISGTFRSQLICKSNSLDVLPLLKQDDEESKALLDRTLVQINDLGNYGYRHFLFMKKDLNEEETLTFLNKYKSAENYVIKSDEHLKALAIEYENNFKFMGACFLDEKTEDDLKISIAKLNNAGIKTWIASGDNKENVVAIARSIGLYNNKTIKADFSDKDKPEDLDIKMSMLLMQFLFPNDKINKMKTRTGANVNMKTLKNTNAKSLTILLSGGCFTRICNDQRNFQSLATLLSYCNNLMAYQFTPNNKFVLCQMIRNYCSKNSKVLAVGDGFNDFTMLKEADLSVGIYSREILQVRNTCDVIVSNFSQIVDLILIHGTWCYVKINHIARFSLYANLIFILPKFLYLNENPVGSCFYDFHYGILTLNILIMNLFIILAFVYEYPVERSLINVNFNVYKSNFFDNETIYYNFGFEFIKGFVDSLIIYFFTRTTYKKSINQIGETVDVDILGSFLRYTPYIIVMFKIYTLRLYSYNFIHIIIGIITIGLLVGVIFINKVYYEIVIKSLTFFPLILNSINITILVTAYEALIKIIKILANKNFIYKLTKIFLNFIKDNSFLKNYQAMYNGLAKEAPATQNKIDKISYPEILENIMTYNKSLDPALENMADVSNEEVARLKIKKPFLEFYDQKVEIDYMTFNQSRLKKVHLFFLIIQALFLVIIVAIERFDGQNVSKIFKIVYILLGFTLFIPKIWSNIYNAIILYFFIVFTIEIICIYIEKDNGNDTKICFQEFVLLPDLLYFNPNFKFSIILTIYYLLGITPAIYLNDFGLTDGIDHFRLRHLPSFYQRHLLIYSIGIILIILSYYSNLSNRVEFLKFHKFQVELKKDNLIMSNLIPDFVRAKMQRGERGAAYGYEIVTMVFCDIYDFDGLMSKLSPKEIINLLDEFYSVLDKFCQLHGLQKIETVGKTYMAAGGIKECEVDIAPMILCTHHAVRCFEFSVDILDLVSKMILSNGDKLRVKIGIHLGKVIPAVVGNHKPQFSLIGDAVNTTSRMCSNSEINCITCSEFAYEEIKQSYKNFTRTTKEIKGKGPMNLYMFNPQKHIKGFFGDMSGPIGRDSSGNLIIRSTTKKVPLLVKQKSKATNREKESMIKSIDKDKANNNVNEDSIRMTKKNEFDESMLIVEDSKDLLFNSNTNNPFSELNNNFGDFNNFNNFNNQNEYYNSGDNNRKKTNQQVVVEKNEMNIDMKNTFLEDSFFFLRFKTDVSKNTFERFQKNLLSSCEIKAINILLFFTISISLGCLMMYQYSITGDSDITIFNICKVFGIVLLICEIFSIKTMLASFTEQLPYVVTIIFAIISFINHFFINKIEDYNKINPIIEESLLFFCIDACGLLSYIQIIINFSIHIVICLIDTIYNYDNFIMKKYNIILIAFCVFRIVSTVIIYSYNTFEFLINQRESKTLVDTEKMLFNLMPLHVVQNMKDDIPVADVLDSVTLLFADIVNYTKFGNSHEPYEVVHLLMELYRNFDDATKTCHVYKVHTIGDCYVVMGFNGKVSMNERNYLEEAKNVCKMGEEMIRIIREVRKKVKFDALDMRIGIHTGVVIAGIIGSSVVRYDIFGSDVLIANKMESAGVPGRINVSEETKKLLETKGNALYSMTLNKVVQIPAVGKEISCFLIDNANADA